MGGGCRLEVSMVYGKAPPGSRGQRRNTHIVFAKRAIGSSNGFNEKGRQLVGRVVREQNARDHPPGSSMEAQIIWVDNPQSRLEFFLLFYIKQEGLAESRARRIFDDIQNSVAAILDLEERGEYFKLRE